MMREILLTTAGIATILLIVVIPKLAQSERDQKMPLLGLGTFSRDRQPTMFWFLLVNTVLGFSFALAALFWVAIEAFIL